MLIQYYRIYTTGRGDVGQKSQPSQISCYPNFVGTLGALNGTLVTGLHPGIIVAGALAKRP